MSIQTTYICDKCDKERSINIIPRGWIEFKSDSPAELSITKSRDSDGDHLPRMDKHTTIHFCGKECLVKTFY